MTRIRFYASGKHDEWEETQKLVDLSMMIIAAMSLLLWGARL